MPRSSSTPQSRTRKSLYPSRSTRWTSAITSCFQAKLRDPQNIHFIDSRSPHADELMAGLNERVKKMIAAIKVNAQILEDIASICPPPPVAEAPSGEQDTQLKSVERAPKKPKVEDTAQKDANEDKTCCTQPNCAPKQQDRSNEDHGSNKDHGWCI